MIFLNKKNGAPGRAPRKSNFVFNKAQMKIDCLQQPIGLAIVLRVANTTLKSTKSIRVSQNIHKP